MYTYVYIFIYIQARNTAAYILGRPIGGQDTVVFAVEV